MKITTQEQLNLLIKQIPMINNVNYINGKFESIDFNKEYLIKTTIDNGTIFERKNYGKQI